MLKLLEKPHVLSTEGDVVCKEALLVGQDEMIARVTQERLHDRRCHQAPREHVPPSHTARVRYVVDHDGYISVMSVYVSFDSPRPDAHWSCFFDAESRRAGNYESVTGNLTFHFLTDAGSCLAGVTVPLARYEEQLVLARLARRGPSAIPEDEGEDLCREDAPWATAAIGPNEEKEEPPDPDD